MKKCSHCKVDKPDNEFFKDKTKKSGLASRCIICAREAIKSWRNANPKKRAESTRRYRKKYPEKCRIRARNWRKNNPEKVKILRIRYLEKTGKEQLSVLREKWRSNNPSKMEEYRKRAKKRWDQKYSESETFRIKHREHTKKWKENNRELYLAMLKTWRKSNTGKKLSDIKKRKLLTSKAIPKWANLRRIESVYKACAAKPGFHVDHIIPIKNKCVCGLHVENNLRIISAVENLAKHNKLLEEFTS